MATILVIDDEDAIRGLLSMVLRSAGHNVVEASNGRQGVALYRQRPTDLAIIDLLMPELNGLDTISQLTREFLGVKIMVITGMGSDESMLSTAKLLGARQTLCKPFEIPELLSTVRYELAH